MDTCVEPSVAPLRWLVLAITRSVSIRTRGRSAIRHTFGPKHRMLDNHMASRRGILQRLLAAASSAGIAGCSQLSSSETDGPTHDLGTNPRADALPSRQHAWTHVLDHDENDNPLPPRHHRVIFLDLTVDVDTPEARTEVANTIEAAMRTLESAYDWGPSGLLHGLAWGTRYFERRDALEDGPIAQPRVLSRTDSPELLSFDAALILASDVPSHLAAVDAAMFGPKRRLGSTAVEDRLGAVFTSTARRRGFIGSGLPAAHANAEGVPTDGPPQDAPLFTGFFSGRSKTQASEDRVTIENGPYAGGTTIHVSHIEESLDRWWNAFDEDDRVARMFSASIDPSDLDEFTDDVTIAGSIREHAERFGVVGHQEKVARAREDGDPIILRRDFNTVHGGNAGLIFVSVQRTLADFRKTRRAMNGWYLRDDHEAITDSDNNGLLDFITVRSRANFYLPPRRSRALPV